MCVGSNAVYRRAALRETDGVVECSQSEDLYTGTLTSTPLILRTNVLVVQAFTLSIRGGSCFMFHCV